MFIFVGRASVLPLDQSGEALPFIIERMGLRIRIVLLALQPSISFCSALLKLGISAGLAWGVKPRLDQFRFPVKFSNRHQIDRNCREYLSNPTFSCVREVGFTNFPWAELDSRYFCGVNK